jgi:hypothetical protein
VTGGDTYTFMASFLGVQGFYPWYINLQFITAGGGLISGVQVDAPPINNSTYTQAIRIFPVPSAAQYVIFWIICNGGPPPALVNYMGLFHGSVANWSPGS